MSAIQQLVAHAARHPIGGKIPIRTLGRIGFWQLRSRALKGPHRVKWVNDSVLIAERGMFGATGNIYFGLHEAPDMAFIAHVLRPGEQFVDAGANVGSFTILAEKVSGAEVHAFEPAAEVLPALRANIAANGLSATVHPVALGDHNGTARFTAGCETTNMISDSGEVVVPLRTLDSFNLRPVTIKADLEGGELGMLRGATETLAQALAIELETLAPEAVEILTGLGFEECAYEPFARKLIRGARNGANCLFVRDFVEVQKRVSEGPVIKWGRLKI